ncbi:DUF5937 family protein (plasmid) [Streptomyces sp. BI20]|uniref:ArsR/SmtB family transcription factor n=1 Tax=Streptomyces sp. BI20 TaxID=3403460 RepID=UPI003C743651
MITLRFTESAEEDIAFSVSPLLEAAYSWHVLADPGHHALHVPWVRRCRRLPDGLRRRLRERSFVVADYVPAFFECRADDHDADFTDRVAAVRALPADVLAAELVRTLVDTTRHTGRDVVEEPRVRAEVFAELRERDPGRAERLGEVLDDPAGVVEEVLAVLEDYWEAAFEEEWERVEPSLYASIAWAGDRIAREGLFPLLRTLVPQIRIDPGRRLLRLDRPHDHDIDVSRERPVTFTAGHYTWPHVRVTCDDPWPVRIAFPALPLTPAAVARPAGHADTLTALQALAAAPRLQIVAHLAGHARSTRELASLLGLSASVVSRHLHQLTRAGLTTTRRDGYYVLYSLDAARLEEIAGALVALGSGTSPAP